MPNSLANTPGILIAQRALQTLLEEFPFLKLISSDFSDEPALFNQQLNVKLPSAFATASTYTGATGYAASDVSQIDVPLTINNPVHVTYKFNDLERASFNTNLIESYARNAAQAVGMSMVDSLLALVKAANFTNSTTTAVNSFTHAAMIGVAKKMGQRKVPHLARFALVNSDYYATMTSDSILVANAGSPSDTVRSGQVGNVHGFRVLEYPQLPNNSENLAGFAGIPESLVIATRVPPPPQTPFPGTLQNVTDENTGLTLQMRQWYNPQEGNEYRSYILMYGVAAGNAATLERLTTA